MKWEEGSAEMRIISEEHESRKCTIWFVVERNARMAERGGFEPPSPFWGETD
jgi:hypothetical protein